MRNFFLIFFFLPIIAFSQSRDAEFQQANQLYAEGKYAEAKEVYEKLSGDKNYSANLFYNLGNTFYKLDQKGSAILNYERALEFNPAHPEAIANLHLLREETGANLFPETWKSKLFAHFHADVYAWIASVCTWVVLFCLAALFFKTRLPRFMLGAVVLVALLIGLYAFASIFFLNSQGMRAIIIASQAEARYAPAESATSIGKIPSGSQVIVLQEQGPWKYVQLPSGERAWMDSSFLEKIRL